MKYPEHYPVKDLWKPEAPENENWRPNWETPLKSTNRELAEMLREAAQSLESEHGFCSQSFAIREAEHRLRHTLDAPPVRTLPMEWRQMANHCSPGAHDALLIVADRLEKECRKSVNQADECRRVLNGDAPSYQQLNEIREILLGQNDKDLAPGAKRNDNEGN